mmetsp:Transcript_6429/g.13259  ORF Transcript_6429/g.13259 Transcript_6429/m.13259 type:complete len:130 (-) Transcript_6429:3-392(-)
MCASKERVALAAERGMVVVQKYTKRRQGRELMIRQQKRKENPPTYSMQSTPSHRFHPPSFPRLLRFTVNRSSSLSGYFKDFQHKYTQTEMIHRKIRQRHRQMNRRSSCCVVYFHRQWDWYHTVHDDIMD